jgi:quercetin dioxygenase-like cupin family protein
MSPFVKYFAVTHRTSLLIAVSFALGVGGMALAQRTAKDQVKVTALSRQDIVEKLDGKDAGATMLEVTLEPGAKDSPHRHAGPVFSYVLEGQYEHAINEEQVKTYRAGETFYEPTGCVHRVASNPSNEAKTRLLVMILHSRDASELTVWEHGDH